MMAWHDLFRHPLVNALGWALFHSLWQGALLTLLLGSGLFLLRRRSANARYLAAYTALVAMLLCPLLTAAVSRSTPPPVPFTFVIPQEKPVRVSAPQAPEHQNGLHSTNTQTLPAKLETVFPAFVIFWLVGVSGLSLRLLRDLLRVQRLARVNRSRRLDSLRYITASLALRMGMTRIPLLLESSRVEVPTMIGWLRAVILIPPSALTGLSPQIVEALLAHELAHIRRHDYLFNLIQAVLETLLFYHPATWWVSQRIRIEREHCCDDLAARTLGDQILYARALASLESLRVAPVPALAVTGSGLLVRVRRLLGMPHVNPHPLSLPGGLLLALCALLGPATLGQYAPPRSITPVATKGSLPRKRMSSIQSAPVLAPKNLHFSSRNLSVRKRESMIMWPAAHKVVAEESRADAVPSPQPVPDPPPSPEMPVVAEHPRYRPQQNNISADWSVNINNDQRNINIQQVKNIHQEKNVNNAMPINVKDNVERISKPIQAADSDMKPQIHPIALPEGTSADIKRNIQQNLQEGLDQWRSEMEWGLHEMERSLKQAEEDIKHQKWMAEQEKRHREQERRQEEQRRKQEERRWESEQKNETRKLKIDFLKQHREEYDKEIPGRKEWMKPIAKDCGFRFG